MSLPTSTLTTGVLGGLFVSKIKNGNPYTSDKLREIHTLETTLLGVATGQYAVTLPMGDKQRVQRWRYLDWIITTPLLLKTLHSLAEEKGFDESFMPAFIANLVMVISGYYAEFLAKNDTTRRFWYLLGVIALVVVLIYVTRWNSYLQDQNVDTQQLPTFFYIGWVLYGINFLTPNEELRQTAFNVLDLFNKGVYSNHLDNVIKTL